MIKTMRHTLPFFGEFLRNPRQTGSIAPSSRFLASEIVRLAGVKKARTIVEFGPGTGVFTREIIQQKTDNAFFIGIEANPKLAKMLQEQLPGTHIVADSAENTTAILRSHNRLRADCIVSGLPWAAFPIELQNKLLQAACDSLCTGGRFATFAYLQGLILPAGITFRKKLRQHFSKVHISRTVWRNVPPALVYRCIK